LPRERERERERERDSQLHAPPSYTHGTLVATTIEGEAETEGRKEGVSSVEQQAGDASSRGERNE